MDDDYALTPVAHDPFASAPPNIRQAVYDAAHPQGIDWNAPADVARGGGMSAYTPTLSEKIGNAASDLMRSAGASPSYAESFGAGARNVAGMLPGLGQAISAYDAGREGAAGNYGMASLAALGAIPGAGKAAEAVEEEAPRIIAYHGSPHSFDRFDMSKIGTGEGAQAYGHGLYFAENEDVAKGYKQTLSRRNVDATLDGQPITNWPKTVDALNQDNWRLGKLVDEYGRVGGPPEDFIQQQRDWYRGQPDMEKALADFQQRVKATHTPGSMYQVSIAANPDHFLDWDKPLSEQHPVVQEAIKAHMASPDSFKGPLRKRAMAAGSGDFSDIDGASALKLLGDYHDPAGASAKLRQAGIPGIKYLDAGSRSAGDGSRNYVVFDDKTISILKKYGLAGLGIGAGGAALMGQDQPASAYTLTPVEHDPFAGTR